MSSKLLVYLDTSVSRDDISHAQFRFYGRHVVLGNNNNGNAVLILRLVFHLLRRNRHELSFQANAIPYIYC